MPPTVSQSLWKDYTQSLEQGRLERERAWDTYRQIAARERRELKEKVRQQGRVLAALPVSGHDQQRLSRQLALRQAIDVGADSLRALFRLRRSRHKRLVPRNSALSMSPMG